MNQAWQVVAHILRFDLSHVTSEQYFRRARRINTSQEVKKTKLVWADAFDNPTLIYLSQLYELTKHSHTFPTYILLSEEGACSFPNASARSSCFFSPRFAKRSSPSPYCSPYFLTATPSLPDGSLAFARVDWIASITD